MVSRPAPGSVTPKQTCSEPSTIRGSVRASSSSEPCLITGCIPKIDRRIALAAFIPPPDFATSSIRIEASVMPNPCPPCSSDVVMPSKPPMARAS